MTIRPAPYPGPRCATHHRAQTKLTMNKAHARRVENSYGITTEQYWTLYDSQGGVCAICRQATGKVRRLAVDHDHAKCLTHPREQGCPRCIRGLLCKRCNQLVAWYGVEKLRRAIDYLTREPGLR